MALRNSVKPFFYARWNIVGAEVKYICEKEAIPIFSENWDCYCLFGIEFCFC